MKNKLLLLILFIIISLSIISCSDWEKDPTSVVKSEATVEEPEGVLLSTNFPKNASAFYFGSYFNSMYSAHGYGVGTYDGLFNSGFDSIFLVGTSDGLFYKSNDYGLNWKKTGEMINKGIIYLFERCSTDTRFFIAGTSKGGYLSSDFGSSWKEILPAEAADGYRMLKFAGFGYNSGKLLISFKNYNKEIRLFSSNDEGKTWETTTFSTNSYYQAPIPDCTDIQECKGGILYNVANQSAIKLWSSTVLFNENMEFSSFKEAHCQIQEDDYTREISTLLVGCKNGVLISTDNGKTWTAKALENKKVYSLVSYGYDLGVYSNYTSNYNFPVYAGTSDGLYVSMDAGYNWVKVDVFGKPEAIVKTHLYGKYLYLVTGSGDSYYFKLSDYKDKALLIPIPILPAYNAVCNPLPALKWSKTNDYNRVAYKLQISADSSFNNVLVDERILKDNYQTNLTETNIKYYWRIRSEKMNGISKWSEVWCFTIK